MQYTLDGTKIALDMVKRDIDYDYTSRKLHKADYDRFVNNIEEEGTITINDETSVTGIFPSTPPA